MLLLLLLLSLLLYYYYYHYYYHHHLCYSLGLFKVNKIKYKITDKRRNQLASEPNYHTAKYFSENVMAIEIKKKKLK